MCHYQKKKTIKTLLFLIAVIFLSPAHASWNNPYPSAQSDQNILYTAFSARPKHLDPARSYGEEAYVFLGQIYEPPLEYHYLHRPYRLQPQTLERMPEIVYFNSANEVVGDEDADIAYTEYRMTLQKGILYQPHPALATDDKGRYHYHIMTREQTSSVKTLSHLDHHGTRELRAEDYVYQIKRIADPKNYSPINSLMQQYIEGLKDTSDYLKDNPDTDLRTLSISGVQAHNDYQYSIRIKGQYQQFIYWLAMPFFAPVPWEADVFYTQPGFKENNINIHWYPIGTGAYMLTENNPNLRMVLEKNPHFRGQYYPTDGAPGDKENGLLDDAGKPIPFIDKVIYTLEKESIPYWNKFLQGYFDSSGISADSFDNAVNLGSTGDISLTDALKEKGIRLNTSIQTSSFYLGFNMLDPVVGGNSERARLLRQAISIAIDYDEYISIFANGRGIPGQSPIPPGIFGYLEGESGINPYVYEWQQGKAKRKNIEHASALMAEAGYTDGIDQETGKPLAIYYESVDSGPSGKARLNWLRKQLEKINIQLIIRSTDYNRFREKMSNGKAQLFMWGWNADYPDPENFLFLLHSSQGLVDHQGANSANYSNPEYDRLFDQMKNMPNSPERMDIIQQMLAIIRHDAPWAFGFHPKQFSLHHGWYKNVKPFIMTNTGTIKYKRIDSEERHRLREEWNQPVLWPLVFIILALAGLMVPAIRAYRQRERSRAL